MVIRNRNRQRFVSLTVLIAAYALQRSIEGTIPSLREWLASFYMSPVTKED